MARRSNIERTAALLLLAVFSQLGAVAQFVESDVAFADPTPQRIRTDGPRLPDIDVSGAADGIVPLPDEVDDVFKIFDRYTKVIAPNGKPIHILVEPGYTDRQVVYARKVLINHLTDLRGSTALYEAVGDAAAYSLVRDHFSLLAAIVRRHDGAVVKTIGDAVMAAFHLPEDALEAALEIQREVAGLNEDDGEGPIVIKLGLHTGPCIAVTLNDRLDYFGTMVNLAARLQGESIGGDIVLSPAFADDVAVAERLQGIAVSRETANLKGFDAPVPFFRIGDAEAAVKQP